MKIEEREQCEGKKVRYRGTIYTKNASACVGVSKASLQARQNKMAMRVSCFILSGLQFYMFGEVENGPPECTRSILVRNRQQINIKFNIINIQEGKKLSIF